MKVLLYTGWLFQCIQLASVASPFDCWSKTVGGCALLTIFLLGCTTNHRSVILFCTDRVNALTADFDLDVLDQIVAGPVEPAELGARAVAGLQGYLGQSGLQVHAVD